MYTTPDALQAEAAYRQSKIAHDFRRATRIARPRGRGEPAPARRRWHLHLRHA
jgi:hypothetical protein